MSFRRLPVRFAGLLALTSLTAAVAEAFGPQLIAQTKIIALDSIVDRSHGAVKWSHGAFLYADLGAGGVPPTFYTLDRDGRLLSSATASIPGSADVSLGDFDRRDDSSIVFIGEAHSVYGQPVPFIALISADGRTERVIRTAPYNANMLGLAPDGTFWTLGYEMVGRNVSAPELNPDAGVLRHFDRAGRLLGSSGPQSQFVKLYTARRLGAGYIAATRSRIGWYAPFWGKGGQYVEIDSNSMTRHSYPGLPDLSTGSLVLSFNLTEAGNAFLSVYDDASERSTTFMFDRAALKWLPIKGPGTIISPGSQLIGVDGEDIVSFESRNSVSFFRLPH
ncbi:MAG: hypothetical protein ACR2JB_23935 [Bryobacteraceae bacterium]